MAELIGVITQESYGVIAENTLSLSVASSGLTINNITTDNFYYSHTQSSALATWTINHNLGKKPNVEIFSVGGVRVDAEVIHISDNQAQVLFDLPYSGFAICS